MLGINEFAETVRIFIDTGGPVIWGILALSIVLWSLIAERFIFFQFVYPNTADNWKRIWRKRSDRNSWRARAIRESIISESNSVLHKTLPIIKTLIALCPLLGLLGTVTGMIHVFDVMSITGTGNTRAMASGVSRATIPTMAGMVIAIPGLYFSRVIESRAEDEGHRLADQLRFD